MLWGFNSVFERRIDTTGTRTASLTAKSSRMNQCVCQKEGSRRVESGLDPIGRQSLPSQGVICRISTTSLAMIALHSDIRLLCCYCCRLCIANTTISIDNCGGGNMFSLPHLFLLQWIILPARLHPFHPLTSAVWRLPRCLGNYCYDKVSISHRRCKVFQASFAKL